MGHDFLVTHAYGTNQSEVRFADFPLAGHGGAKAEFGQLFPSGYQSHNTPLAALLDVCWKMVERRDEFEKAEKEVHVRAKAMDEEFRKLGELKEESNGLG